MQKMNPPSMGDGNNPNYGSADIEPQEASYDVPSAGGSVVPGGYGAPTPHAAAVSEDPYMAPQADLADLADNSWPMAEGGHTWTNTPGMVKGSTDFNEYDAQY